MCSLQINRIVGLTPIGLGRRHCGKRAKVSREYDRSPVVGRRTRARRRDREHWDGRLGFPTTTAAGGGCQFFLDRALVRDIFVSLILRGVEKRARGVV